MRDRLRAVITTTLAMATILSMAAVAPVAAADPLKVVVIVGPTGGQTAGYKATGNEIAEVATEAGAEVVKVYSPRATWARVRNAVEGANVVVYLGHGNGSPSPYSSTEWPDRNNGWGLNRTTRNGDRDDWSRTMVYCGEKALLGTLTSNDGAAQWQYCGGAKGTDGINPAASWVMIYNKACYAPGAGEGWDTKATEAQAFKRVSNYSTPALKTNGGTYFATDMWQGGEQLVDLVLRNREMTFGDIAQAANGFDMFAQRRFSHPDVDGRQVWIQRTANSMGTDYWFAYAGNPSMTPSGVLGHYELPPAPTVTAVTPLADEVDVSGSTTVTATFDQQVTKVNGSSFTVRDVWGLSVPGAIAYSSTSRRATFTPSVPLEAGLTYRATLSRTIRGIGGPLARQSWTFTVAGAVSPSITLFGEPQDLVVERGTDTRYQFKLTGELRSARTDTLDSTEVMQTTMQRSLPGQTGRWLYVSSGSWAGNWLRESSAAHLAVSGAMLAAEDSVGDAQSVRIRRGTHTGYRFDASGVMQAARTRTQVGRDAPADQVSTLPGQAGLWFHMTGGGWNGYWLRASDVVFLVD